MQFTIMGREGEKKKKKRNFTGLKKKKISLIY